MKLKLGFLLAGLMVAQVSTNVMAMAQAPGVAQREAVSQAAQTYLAGAKAAPAGLTDSQKVAYKTVEDKLATIATKVDTKIIPLVEKAVQEGSFSFFDGGKLLVTEGPGLLTDAIATIDAIKALHATGPSARLVIKQNLENTYKRVQFDKLVTRLTNLVTKLSDSGATGAIKGILLKVLPKLNDIPKLIAQQL